MLAEFLRGKDHEQRFTRTLKMPDQPLFDVARNDTLDNLIGGLVLLIAANDLDLTVLFVSSEKRKVLQDIQQNLWPQHTNGSSL